MSRFRRIEIIDPYYPSFSVRETSIFTPKTLTFPSFVIEEPEPDFNFAIDLLNPTPSPFELFDTYTDLIQVERTPSFYSYKRIHQRVGAEQSLLTLCDRVSELESKFDRLLNAKVSSGDRKYTWTADVKGPLDRKYKLTAEIKEDKKKKEEKKAGIEKNYKWTAQIKGKGENGLRSYTFKASSGDAGESSGSDEEEKEKKKKKKSCKKDEKKGKCATRLVEIEEPSDHGAIVLRQAFAKRAGAARSGKGKQKELSLQDAALIIQISFRTYLIRRSQALRALRDLAVAKAKLKEIRALFNNFSYRKRIAGDAAERQRFSEKIIVLLLTVNAIEGTGLMVRAAKRSMIDELEAILDVVDPQPTGKSLSMRRRTFDMPDGVIRKEIAEGVAQVVRMLDNEERSGDTFEACM
ncbi:putative BCL-2-associated athanogene 7 [Tripterygium wilfordii]|uniref:Putative BCL-2-associated athanogene 7 n=1 Tax=Tripterygium wilfordii TaxID=458696 RepID=A0A7J7CAF2_TRIWF|nr:BAG family molecular chaperone regulator 7-like [Tripterygium wilfordii]KAF5731070.1 putative BCL-2-associated athanogene 7 [Tripterygium wilfordii]